MSAVAAIALGSNLGDRKANLHEARRRLGGIGVVCAISSFHATAPVGYLDQPDFLNAALLLRTELAAPELMLTLLQIEETMGRVRRHAVAKGPRLIDLDLLLYDQLVLDAPGLTVPHPEMHRRAFVLQPLAEIAPAWVHPVLGKTIAALSSSYVP